MTDQELNRAVQYVTASTSYGRLLGKAAPPYVALFALAVTKDNVLQAWKDVYHTDPPAELGQ